MANILGIFTAIILAVAAFVAIKNNARLEEEISNRDTEEQSLAVSQERLKVAQALNKKLPVDIAGVEENIATATAKGVELKEQNDNYQAEIDTKSATIAENKEQLDETNEKLAKLGDLRQLAQEMKTKAIELEELGVVIDASNASIANLTQQNESAQSDATRRKTELDTMSKGESLPSLRTRIKNIYPTWGFVTLRDGNNAGVIANSTLDVVRDGETIAKLLVTAVELGSSSASIIPDSLSEDVTLMVGDRVVPTTKKAVEEQAAN
ncbi:MAG: hypothetical protein AB8D78_13550 [Akkermansiaceae bacterium]